MYCILARFMTLASAESVTFWGEDTQQMALHQTEGWGYDRIMRITHNWVAVQREGRADPVPRAVSQCKEDQIREVRYG